MIRAKRTLLLTLFVIAALTASATNGAQPPAYDAFYVFGDSLSDTGNDLIATKALQLNPAIPPSETPHRSYFQGRFSNGPVALEYLWALVNPQAFQASGLKPFLASADLGPKGAFSFAFGGSTSGFLDKTPGNFFVPGLRTQVGLFQLALKGKAPAKRALYAIFTGANDYVVVPPDLPHNPADVVANITAAITQLYRLGARDIIVLNLPDLGRLPLVANDPNAAGLSFLSAAHNTLLAQSLTNLGLTLKGINLIAIDVNAVLQALPPNVDLTTPALDHLFPPLPNQPPASLCLFLNPGGCPNVTTFAVSPLIFFWDAEHPTTAVHQVLGQYLYSRLFP